MTKAEIKQAKIEMQKTKDYFELERHRTPKGFKVEIQDDNVTQRLMVNGVSVTILAGTGLCNIHRIEGVLDALSKLSRLQDTIKTDPVKIAVVLDGGRVEDVVSNQPIDEVIIVDNDLDGVEEDNIRVWTNGVENFTAYIYDGEFSYNSGLIDHLYAVYDKK